MTVLLLRMHIRQEKERTKGGPTHALSAWCCPPIHLCVLKAHNHVMRCACVSYLRQAPFCPRSNMDINARVKLNTVALDSRFSVEKPLGRVSGELTRLV